MRRWFFLFLLSFPGMAFALEEEPEPPFSFAFDPPSLLMDCVQVVEGGYAEAGSDLCVRCAEPIDLRRVGPDVQCVEGCTHVWRLEDEHIVFLVGRQRKLTKPKWKEPTLWLQEASGAVIRFEPEEVSGFHPFEFPYWKARIAEPEKLCNANGALNGRADLRNYRLRFDAERESVTLFTGSGEQRIYRAEEPWYQTVASRKNRGFVAAKLLLREVRRPSGNRLLYSYDSKSRLCEIRAVDETKEQTLGWLKIKHIEQEGRYRALVTASDGQKLTYEVATEEGLLLSKIKGSDGALELHRFRKLGRGYYVDQRSTPAGRAFALDYSPSDQKVVEAYLSHVIQETPKSLAALAYQDEKTHVTDACGQRRSYTYDKEGHLTSISHLGLGDKPKLSEHFEWKDGRLARWLLVDRKNRRRVTRSFTYDARGNVIRETLEEFERSRRKGFLFAGLFGRAWRRVAEPIVREFSYSQDGFNLLTSATDGRVRLEYRYKPKTNLITHKLTYEGELLRERELHTYDDNAVCVRSVWDDGCGLEEDDLSGVTERRIRVMLPRSDAPGIGLPEVVESRYLDLETGKEQQMTRKVLHYSDRNLVVREELFNSLGELCWAKEFAYDEKGRCISEKDALGHETRKTYDSDGYLVRVEEGLVTTETTYDGRGLPLSSVKSDGQASLRARAAYDALGRKIRAVDACGRVTEYLYDCMGNEIWVGEPDEGWETHRVYDAHDRLIEETNPAGETTRYAYNARGQRTHTQYPDGTRESWSYDPQGHLVRHTAPLGAITEYERDYRGRAVRKRVLDSSGALLAEWTYAYRGSRLVETTDPQGCVTTFCYDGAGRLIEEFCGERRTTYAWDDLGRKTRMVRGGLVTAWEYDALGRKIEEREESLDGAQISKRAWEYDRWDRVIAEEVWIDKDETARTTWEYDLEGRLTRIVDPLGQETRFSYERGFGRVVQTKVGPAGIKTVTTLDAEDRPVRAEVFDSNGFALLSRRITYDGAGRVSQREENGHLITAEYGPGGHLRKRTEAVGKPEEQAFQMRIEEGGHFDVLEMPGGLQLQTHRDCQGNVTLRSGADHTYAYAYDALGRVIKVTDAGGYTATRVYDRYGQLIEETQVNGWSLQFEYDALGRRTAICLPDGSAVHYTYGPKHLKSIERLGPDGREKYAQEYFAYDQRGLPLEVRLPGNAGMLTYEWDQIGRCTRLCAPEFFFVVPSEGYDRRGKLCQVDTPGGEMHLAYDGLGRLVAEPGHTYSYDGLGNRVVEDGQLCKANALNQAVADPHGHYEYDAQGRMTGRLVDGREIRYAYDTRDNLIEVSCDSWMVRSTYDPFGRRMTKEVYRRELPDGAWERESFLSFLYDGREEIAAFDESGEVIAFRMGAFPSYASVELNGTPYVAIQDVRGSVVRLLDFEGGLVESIDYSAFGVPSGASLVGNPWGFCGKRFDSESGLFYFGLRYYFPEVGRWLSRDPEGFRQGLNLYRYCFNDPWGHVDPDGQFVICLGAITLTKLLYVAVGLAATYLVTSYVLDDSHSGIGRKVPRWLRTVVEAIRVSFVHPGRTFKDGEVIILPVGGVMVVSYPRGDNVDGIPIDDLFQPSRPALHSESSTSSSEEQSRDHSEDLPRPEGIPDDWIEKPAKKGGGKRYYNPNDRQDHVRVMPGKSDSPNPAQRKPYVVRQQRGQIVDKQGNPVSNESPEAHIPLEDFVMLP